MIIDLKQFIQDERPFWDELEETLQKRVASPDVKMNLREVARFHYLYQRASADLGRITTFSAEAATIHYLESLVGRAYSEIHENRHKSRRQKLFSWFFSTFPRTFRRHAAAFALSVAAMAGGSLLGGGLVLADADTKGVLLPFEHLQQHPSERVAKEENTTADRLSGGKAAFSSYLMTHNIKVSIFTLALGMTWGIGTLIMLFYNGVILGAVAFDYLAAGEAKFLLGWLLPHGSIEIPAILLAGQAGLVLAGALIGWRRPLPLKLRLRSISNDLVTLMGGIAVMLIWAGIVESFLSQYHEPVIPYAMKIAFGVFELVVLTLFLAFGGGSRGQKRSVANI